MHFLLFSCCADGCDGCIKRFRSRRSPASSSHGCIAMPLRPMSHGLCHKRYKVSPVLCHNCHKHSVHGR
ncbi:hypothetical protein C4K37_5875 [Pseudomonas chlororaphis subsp. piscium]|nr:hypothetical protein C4K37_5875 [Pseudomonas chlororaphis subsp. piscium]AZC46784.1 hypothetical protein C4K36_5894 [Pseudomonas chlororaphis subsp. piscium]AZC72174.1 hypothetical protein C4K32_5547 [Pseudomonas chlororaphis subsp. piscium]